VWITICRSILHSRSKKKSWPKWKTNNLLLRAAIMIQVWKAKTTGKLSELEIRLILERLLKWKWQRWIIRICILMFLTIPESITKRKVALERGAPRRMRRSRNWIYKSWRRMPRLISTTLSRVWPRELFQICALSEEINLLNLYKGLLTNIQVYCPNLGGFNNNFVRLRLKIF